MTTRQRQATGTATAPIVNGTDAAAEKPAHFSWDEWFRHASAQQRAEALSLAQRQGLIYPSQLPATTNGVKPTATVAKETETSQAIGRLLAGKAEGLSRLQTEALSFFDAELDDLQQQAVARALATPDVMMLQGLPGTGKSRLLAEIVLQAAARGWRVLFLAGQPASLDVILQRLIGRPEILALRFLDTHEKPESLPGWLRSLTFEEQKKAFVERTVNGARANHAAAETACQQRRDEEPLWSDLRAYAEQQRELDVRLQVLRDQLPRIAADVERETEAPNADAPFVKRVAALRDAHDLALTGLDADLKAQQEAQANQDQLDNGLAAEISQREPAYLAKKHGRFWSPRYWLNLFNGSLIQEMETLLEKRAHVWAEKQEISRRIDHLTEQRNRRNEQYAQERAAILAAEIQVRQQVLLTQQQELDSEAKKLDALWTGLCSRLPVAPKGKTLDAVAMAHDAWQQRRAADERQSQFTQQWTRFVQDAGSSLAAKLPTFANLLAGTLLRWHTDAKFRDAVGEPVDLLIVEDAETLTEADLLKVARHGRRCVLVGQALTEPAPMPTAAEKASRALLPAPLVSTVCWTKLWQLLGGEAGRWPCNWQREADRLVCQLIPLAAEDRQYLESEGLADAADIELSILHRPNTRPCLAQVIFAPQCSFDDAFRFMMREVQEFPVQPAGLTAWWSEDAQQVRRHLGANAPPIDVWLDIEPGVRLGYGADQARIARIEFDKTASWDRVKAEAWIHRHHPTHDHERTVLLQTPYRFGAPLAAIVQTMVRVHDWLPVNSRQEPTATGGFEFVAVPAPAKNDWPRDGAGLELDLSAVRHADRLPVGLRQGLPTRGFVNYLEAQALIRRLEAWQQQESSAGCPVAVLALYEGQVELLRRLVEQSEILRGRQFPLEVALPSRLHQRECDVVFLSMTRSHGHRSVAFGEDVKELPLAMTRPRCRLLMFGDPGSLFKRTTWHGPIDHLDAHSAQQELQRLSCLLACLQKQGHSIPTANGSALARA